MSSRALSGIWKRIEIVGDVAIIGIPFNMSPEEVRPFAMDVMRENSKVRAVWGRPRGTEGNFRLSHYVHICGEMRSETLYRENGATFLLDFRKVFFSQTLSYEHRRISSLVRRGETVINMFSGYGPFSILSKIHGAGKVYSMDINPYAYYYTMVNVELNKAYGVLPILGDAFKRIYEVEKADRIICPLPERDEEAFEVAKQRVKGGGESFIHVFAEVKVNKGENPVKEALRKFKGDFARVVRSVKPGTYHVVVDVRV
ncbi:class I SAM-dependent methyltransferase [Sulfuracidifex tepidarius]|uniref:tRNA (Guanine(37)-N1)-methyltransferase Trm5b n=1 Tax=Sulfuracidifex tepidarius TaxID=1294262 RepID=A0A510E6C1_9CREN|nr:50S ribosomal protein L11 methyltransferase [Sulfuracidifex tepidarius]BBG25280.1 tRNA (guanine(37)-N1)-methyltransferase Trm5b [Sulfuracidifex tepidarius]BBG28074.1 tRNA (guanine(37)-N1)-methyltransferase Trm5b [Sulfuracidifex tepidarius]